MKNTEKMTRTAALTYVLTTFDLPADVKEKLEGIKTSLEKKADPATRKPTKTQLENEGVKTQILEAITGKHLRAQEVANECGLTSAQKASALLRQLVAEGKAVKGEGPKGSTVFTAA